jgi:hypothetical protein
LRRINKDISLACSCIANIGLTYHPALYDLLFTIEQENEDSASEKPVTQYGESLFLVSPFVMWRSPVRRLTALSRNLEDEYFIVFY